MSLICFSTSGVSTQPGQTKQIAYDLGISEVTMKLHRSNVMRKLQASSIGELIRIWEVLPVPIRETCAA